MIAILLIKKILSLFLILILGVVLVKRGVLQDSDSKALSVLSLYLIMPCVILSAFQIEATAEVKKGLLLAVGAAVLVHAAFILVTRALTQPLRLDPVEQLSLVYSNAGNLIVPLVTAILGDEWVIYSSAYVSVQLFLLWSHGLASLCGEKKLNLKKILTNGNMLAILVGLALFFTGLRFPSPIQSAMDDLGGMLAPAAMLITGMLIGGMKPRSILAYRRVWLVAALRLVGFPMLILALIWLTGAKHLFPIAPNVLLVVLLATMTPSASTIPQMAQVYHRDASYASIINVITTLLCIATMPCMVLLYQMI